MEKWKRKKSLAGKAGSFQPNRDYINHAVEDYLKSGGKIKPLFAGNRNYDVNSKIGLFYEADDFLFGN
jgi:hypothetical protein